jgi:hypothetical protein
MVHPRLFPSCLPHPLATSAAGSFRFVSFTLGPFSRESLSRARWISPLVLGRAPFAFAFAPAFPLYDPVEATDHFTQRTPSPPCKTLSICVAIVRLRRARSDGSTRGSPIGIRAFGGELGPTIGGATQPLPGNARLLIYAGFTGRHFCSSSGTDSGELSGVSRHDGDAADQVVAPFEHQQFYIEKIVHLPDCFQISDSKRKIVENAPTRQKMGLPERAFVFCRFNVVWKITPAIFDTWMQLLHWVEGSVLWLLGENESAERNLKEAQQRGIDPSRLVFAGRLPFDEYLARDCLADSGPPEAAFVTRLD